jgi:hypothetical protein
MVELSPTFTFQGEPNQRVSVEYQSSPLPSLTTHFASGPVEI